MCDFSSFESSYKGYAFIDAEFGIYVDDLEDYYYKNDYADCYVYYSYDEDGHSINSYTLLGYAFLVDDYDVSNCYYDKVLGQTIIYMPMVDFKKYMLKYLDFIHTFKKKHINDFLYWMDDLYAKAYSLKMIDELEYKSRLLFYEYKDLYEGVFNKVEYLFRLIEEYLVIDNNLVLLS